jgi:hypothetical protein
VHGQFKPVRKQGLHHQSHLVLCRIALRLGLNFVTVRAQPFRRVCERIRCLKGRKLIRELDERLQGKPCVEAATARFNVIRAKAEGWGPGGSLVRANEDNGRDLARLNGSNVERHLASGLNLPIRRILR